MNLERTKLDIIDWIKGTDSEQLVYILEKIRLEEFSIKTTLTEEQKRKIISSINTLEE